MEIRFAKRTAAPSLIPHGTYEPGIEKYALGRKFITESGLFGLGPKGAQAGDRVVVLVRSSVPFVPRDRTAGESSRDMVSCRGVLHATAS